MSVALLCPRGVVGREAGKTVEAGEPGGSRREDRVRGEEGGPPSPGPYPIDLTASFAAFSAPSRMSFALGVPAVSKPAPS
ncbi:hypothetical protein GCM10010420_53850 [Streptomyces glaucosporus]|uniref:Secreted protein n=1 Tax=Streptomyces glaucosporus TaxID=284044 RepID=A0ABP5W0L4_9ACTN